MKQLNQYQDTRIGCVQHDCDNCKKHWDLMLDHIKENTKLRTENEALKADRDQLQRDFTYIKQRRDVLRVALEKLARLGNGDRYGNSEGNAIAIAALNGE